jgi:hypothetical protein
MRTLTRIFGWLYTHSLNRYPAGFYAEFGDEMQAVFEATMLEAEKTDWPRMLMPFGREIRDWPGAVWREHWSALTKKEFSMTTIHKKPEWFFYPAWIILQVISFPIAYILSFVILRVITDVVGDYIYVDGVRHITVDYLALYSFVPIVSLVMGVLQYGLLRRYLPRMGWWVLATTGGWLLGVLLILISGWLNFWTSESFDVDLAFIVLGFSIGVGQWLLLRRRLPRAGWWIGANVVGWVLLGLITGGPLHQFGLLGLGFLPACVTAAMLALLMNRAQPAEPQGV